VTKSTPQGWTQAFLSPVRLAFSNFSDLAWEERRKCTFVVLIDVVYASAPCIVARELASFFVLLIIQLNISVPRQIFVSSSVILLLNYGAFNPSLPRAEINTSEAKK